MKNNEKGYVEIKFEEEYKETLWEATESIKSEIDSSVIKLTEKERIKYWTTIADQAWDLFKQENWSELEDLFINNGLNNSLPPSYGGKNLLKIEIGSQLIGKRFDRFQGPGELNGEYASPVYTQERELMTFSFYLRFQITKIQYTRRSSIHFI